MHCRWRDRRSGGSADIAHRAPSPLPPPRLRPLPRARADEQLSSMMTGPAWIGRAPPSGAAGDGSSCRSGRRSRPWPRYPPWCQIDIERRCSRSSASAPLGAMKAERRTMARHRGERAALKRGLVQPWNFEATFPTTARQTPSAPCRSSGTTAAPLLGPLIDVPIARATLHRHAQRARSSASSVLSTASRTGPLRGRVDLVALLPRIVGTLEGGVYRQ